MDPPSNSYGRVVQAPFFVGFLLEYVQVQHWCLSWASRGSTGVLKTWTISWTTLPETNVVPENRPSQKESSFPTSHFQKLC